MACRLDGHHDSGTGGSPDIPEHKMRVAQRSPCTLLLVALLSTTATGPLRAQADDEGESGRPTTLTLGTLRTAAEAAAVRLAVRYAEEITSVFQPGRIPPGSPSGTSYLLDFAPAVSIETGDNDAFNGVIAK